MDNIIDRDALQDLYVDVIIDSMDTKDLCQFVSESLHESLDKYSFNELLTEVEDYYPHLLEEPDVPLIK
tara:strand:+ start:39 stop:245 length:207 start_codon:yes stop_codon:yes gene_type:complete